MKFFKIKQVCQVNPTIPKNIKSFSEEKVSFVPMSSLQVNGTINNVETKQFKDVKKGYRYFEIGDVIFAKITPCMENGKAAHVKDLPLPIAFGSTEFHVLRPNENLDAKYLSYLIRRPSFRKIAEKNMTGSGGQKRVTSSFLSNYKIPIPESYEDQIRIATLLSRVEALIAKRKESIQLLDELLKSTFLEMFGNPVKNEKGWDKSSIKSFSNVKIGPFGSLLHAEDYMTNGIPLINPSHIFNGKIIPDPDTSISENKFLELSKYHLQENDIILGRRGEIGRSAVVTNKPEKMLCGTGSLLIRIKDSCLSSFLQFQIANTSLRDLLESKAKGITMKNLNAGIVEKLKVILPPLSLQNKFAQIVEKMESMRAGYEVGLLELENLYGSLSQRAFRGELDLSGVPVALEALEKSEEPLLSEQKEEASVSIETNKPKRAKKKPPYSQTKLKELLLKQSGQSFTFEELEGLLEKSFSDNLPNESDLLWSISLLVGEEEPILNQSYSEERHTTLFNIH